MKKNNELKYILDKNENKKYVHKKCLKEWIIARYANDNELNIYKNNYDPNEIKCEICKSVMKIIFV